MLLYFYFWNLNQFDFSSFIQWLSEQPHLEGFNETGLVGVNTSIFPLNGLLLVLSSASKIRGSPQNPDDWADIRRSFSDSTVLYVIFKSVGMTSRAVPLVSWHMIHLLLQFTEDVSIPSSLTRSVVIDLRGVRTQISQTEAVVTLAKCSLFLYWNGFGIQEDDVEEIRSTISF